MSCCSQDALIHFILFIFFYQSAGSGHCWCYNTALVEIHPAALVYSKLFTVFFPFLSLVRAAGDNVWKKMKSEATSWPTWNSTVAFSFGSSKGKTAKSISITLVFPSTAQTVTSPKVLGPVSPFVSHHGQNTSLGAGLRKQQPDTDEVKFRSWGKKKKAAQGSVLASPLGSTQEAIS